MFARYAGPSTFGRWCCNPIIPKFVLHHPHCEFFPIFQRRHRRLIRRARPSLHRICLCHRQNERELSIRPPFCRPSGFQTNRIVSTIVHVVNPMFATVVAGEQLRILERLPRAVHEPPGRVVLDLVEQPVRRHDLRDIVTIFRTMNQKASPLDYLYECLTESQWLTSHIFDNVVPRDKPGPVLMLLDEELEPHSLLVESHDARRNAKAIISRHHLPRAMDGLRHVQQ